MDGRKVDRDAAVRLGKNLWGARRKAGYSQERLAALCSLHYSHISLIERGKRLPRIDTAMKLASALEIPVQVLIEGIEWLPPGPPPDGSFSVRRPS